jgi:hypothetical protein
MALRLVGLGNNDIHLFMVNCTNYKCIEFRLYRKSIYEFCMPRVSEVRIPNGDLVRC